MKFLKFFTIILLSSSFLTACEKDQELVEPVTAKETPIPPVPPVLPASNESIHGTWSGKSAMANKSIPKFISFKIKGNGQLDLLNSAKEIIGTGTWTLDGGSFKASYTNTSTGLSYSCAGDYYELMNKLMGTWGPGSNFDGGGFWYMDKID